MTRLAYDTDLSDDQWELIAPDLPAVKSGGRPRTLNLRKVVNAIFYLLASGIKWRVMPHDLPRWQSVYTYFRAWEHAGTWHQLNEAGRTQLRLQAGRKSQPSAGSVDSQSVKTARGGEDISFDGGKKVKGRKRTILVDTMGLLLAACVHGAGRSDPGGMA
jgi:putative transposase